MIGNDLVSSYILEKYGNLSMLGILRYCRGNFSNINGKNEAPNDIKKNIGVIAKFALHKQTRVYI